ncbi:UDP-2,3-diacylglucosamine diphosphatase [Rhodopirellula baltica]|uniref:Metallophosphoesterase n=1 Tax=Rhodopirellula baltica WH47 TaxID=991778 RepID=F2AKY2_RHOBT|nr:UDP-2,3-diacylglucosamine diphosphatase [Rhodopirellula baltica]EGF29661.1 metallophosphoesterase [Rhodopirellula baltica WH47]
MITFLPNQSSTVLPPRRRRTGPFSRSSATVAPAKVAAEHRATRSVRSIFISDVHLGLRHAQVDRLLSFLNSHSPEHLYLVGDFIDARVLHMQPYWPPIYDRLLNRLAELAAEGTAIHYTPGNHDDYLRHVDWPEVAESNDVTVGEQFVHETVDGRRVVVLHGDQFDKVERQAHWLSLIGTFLYTMLLTGDRAINRVLKWLRMKPRRISRYLKQTTKRMVQWVSGFKSKVRQHACENDCDAIVCGHIHIPTVRRLSPTSDNPDAKRPLYFNLGDWVENATAMVEYGNGELELIDFDQPDRIPPASAKSQSQATDQLTPKAAAIKRHLFTGMG